jgi:hypothetical protein
VGSAGPLDGGEGLLLNLVETAALALADHDQGFRALKQNSGLRMPSPFVGGDA